MTKLDSYFNRPVGIFNWVLDGEDPVNCARLAEEYGFSCIQWSLPKEGSGDDRADAEAALEAFGQRGIKIVALSGYQNIVAADPALKASAMQELDRYLSIASLFPDSLGLATETGTKNLDSQWRFHPDNLNPATWEEMLASLKLLIAKAKASSTRILIEGYVENVVRTAEDIARLKAELGSDGLGYVMDPFNLILEEKLPQLALEIEHIFDAIGSDYGVAHAKDLLYTDGVVDTPRSGGGMFDFQTYFKLLDQRLPGVPLILEHLALKEVEPTLDFLKSQYRSYPNAHN